MKESVGESSSAVERFSREERDSFRVCALCPAAFLALVLMIRFLLPAALPSLVPIVLALPYLEVTLLLTLIALLVLGILLLTGCALCSVTALFHDVPVSARVAVSAFNVVALGLGPPILLSFL